MIVLKVVLVKSMKKFLKDVREKAARSVPATGAARGPPTETTEFDPQNP